MAVDAQVLRKGFDLTPILREAGIAGFVAAALTIGLVGFETIDVGGRLTYTTRFGAVAWAVAIVFLGRIGLALIRAGRPLPTLIGSVAAAIVWAGR